MTTATRQASEQANSPSKPFLKWAGGKTQLLGLLLSLKPDRFGKYIEPFVGGGAMFFALRPDESVLADSNEELIATYTVVRDDVESLIERLRRFSNDKESFYEVRSLNAATLSPIDGAARLIYLNKTCFNGLYRVNKKGQFNTPYNGVSGSKFLQPEVLRGASKALQGITIVASDYKDLLSKFARKDDFVFLDPPYEPVGKYSDFKRYTKERFYANDQADLAKEFTRLVKIGCKVILTNSAHPSILDLYKEYEIRTVKSKRLISSNPRTRNGEDLIILGGF